MINQNNFNWAETEVPLCIFIPNYGRGNYIRSLLKQFQTKASVEKYRVVIGNDGLHEDFDDLRELNVRYFTLERSNPNIPRNGAFIRNFFIKRCLAKNIFQKDPETEICPITPYSPKDWIEEYGLLTNTFIRPAITFSVNSDSKPELVIPGVSHRVHWGFLAPLSVLRSIRGYNEQFTKYGYEDTELYEFIMNNIDLFHLDRSLIAIHHPHDVDPVVYQEVNQMGQIYHRVSRDPAKRNENGWGEGK